MVMFFAATPSSCSTCTRLRVWGLRFEIHLLGSVVWGLRVKGVRCRVQDVVRGVSGSGFRVKGLRFRVKDLGLRIEGLGFRVKGLGFRV